MNEDSKEMANTGAYGLKLSFHAHPAIPTEEFVSIMEGLLRSIGEKVTQKGYVLIGHAKAFITTKNGTLKVNLIDTDLGPESLDRLNSPAVEEGEMKFMCVLMKLTDHEVEEIMEEGLQELEDRMEITVEKHVHEGHEHKNENHNENHSIEQGDHDHMQEEHDREEHN